MKLEGGLGPWIAGVALAASLSPAGAQQYNRAGYSHETGGTPGVVLTDISNNPDTATSVFPMIVVSRSNPDLVVVAWRRFGTPVDNDSPNRLAECHASISTDGGKTYTDHNLLPYLDTDTDVMNTGDLPRLRGGNAPWAAIGNDGTIYSGCSMSSTRPDLTPKQGRAGVVVSSDMGKTWTQDVVGLRLEKLAPGLKGLNGGMEPVDTPWDGANGAVDPQTGTFYSAVGNYIVASDDKARSFGTVYASKGHPQATFGIVAATNTSMEGDHCPCLVLSLSRDKGKTWTDMPIAKANQYDRQGAVRYPIVAANPVKQGSYAVSVYQPDHKSVKTYYTADFGKTWKMAAPRPIPNDVAFMTVNQLSTGYTMDGKILVTWRAWRNVAAHNTFVAMLDGDSFGPTVKVTPVLSIDPPNSFDGWYSGDFTNWVNGNKTDAFVTFAYSPLGKTSDDIYVGRVPLTLLTKK